MTHQARRERHTESGQTMPTEPRRKKAELRMRYGLTAQESKIALCVSGGLTYAEIAEALRVSYHTVCSHVKSILLKTNARCRRLTAIVARL